MVVGGWIGGSMTDSVDLISLDPAHPVPACMNLLKTYPTPITAALGGILKNSKASVLCYDRKLFLRFVALLFQIWLFAVDAQTFWDMPMSVINMIQHIMCGEDDAFKYYY